MNIYGNATLTIHDGYLRLFDEGRGTLNIGETGSPTIQALNDRLQIGDEGGELYLEEDMNIGETDEAGNTATLNMSGGTLNCGYFQAPSDYGSTANY